VELLVSNGANVNVQSQNGFTPLYMVRIHFVCFSPKDAEMGIIKHKKEWSY